VKRRVAIAIVFANLLVTTLVVGGVTIPPLATQATKILEQAPALQNKRSGFSRVSRSVRRSADSIPELSRLDEDGRSGRSRVLVARRGS